MPPRDVTELPLFQYIAMREKLDEQIASTIQHWVENLQFTPKQIAEEFTIQQLLHLWEFKTTEEEVRVA